MMQLTKCAKKTLLIGLIVQLFIFLSISLIYKALILSEQSLIHHFKSQFNIQKVIRLAKKQSASSTIKLLRQSSKPWVRFSLTKKALFKISTLTEIEKHALLTPLAERVNYSFKISEEKYINIATMPPFKLMGTSLAIIGLFLFSVFSFLMINYWMVKTLNAPIQKLVKNLDYANKQHLWQPLALIGDPDQNDIFNKINRLQEHNQKLLQERTQMLAAISHDLRTPLTRIKLRAEYFESNDQYPKLQNDISEMENMIHESLTYFQAVNKEEVSQGVDIGALLEALIEDHPENQRAITLNLGENKVIIQGQFNLLKRAFSNLLNNAIHYGKTVSLSISLEKGYHQILISDKGPGIKPGDLENVFNPFYRADSSRSKLTAGTGLGLTIAKEIIQRHEGKITLRNLKKGGLEVLVSFKAA